MGFVLLWIEALATVWLLGAALVALAGRRQRRWVQFAIATVTLPLPAYTFVMTWLALQRSGETASPMVVYIAAWVALANAGVLALIVVGLWRRGQPAEPRARSWKAGRLAAGSMAAGLFCALTLWTMTNALLSRVAALRAEAGTLALAAAPARLPDHENAARHYEAAAELLREAWRPGDDEKLTGWLTAERLNPEDADLRVFLRRRSAAIELIDGATALSGCRFDTSPAEILGAMLGVNYVRAGADVLALEARYFAARGIALEGGGQTSNRGIEGGLTRVDQLRRMAQHLAGNGDVNSMLAAAALETRALTTLDQVLVQGVPAVTVMANIPSRNDPSLYRADLRRALRMEQALAYGRLAGIAEQASGYGLVWLRDDLAVHEALFRRLTEELAKPYPECLHGWAGVEAQLRPFPGVLHRLSTPANALLLPAVARADASRRVAQLAVAVARYCRKQLQLPARAEDLVREYLQQVPTDPFTGEPLKFKATADGVVVYSVGPDGVDDDGSPLTEDRPQKGDIRVRIGRTK
jgi:hypothetical protein